MTVRLRLYVSRGSGRSSRAIEVGRELDRMLGPRGGGCEILDVSANAAEAESDRILATPTLLRREPEPVLRIIGDLTDLPRLLQRLGIPNNDEN